MDDNALLKPGPSAKKQASRVLYVEDDEGLAALMQGALSGNNIVMDHAEDGEAGLEAYDPLVHDAVILDYQLPGMNGMQILERLMPEEGSEDVMPAVIMLTGQGNESLAVQALLKGASNYVIKDSGLNYLELLPVIINNAMHRKALEEEKKETEQVLLRYIETLESLYQEVLNAKKEADEARQHAEEAGRVKEDFLHNMSHEIRTPMNGVLAMAELMQHTELDEEQAHYAQTILSSGTLLVTILNDILDISKIEAGELTLEHVSFGVGEISSEIMQLNVAVAAERNVEVAMWVSPDVPDQVIGDATRIKQILLNLISNAIKFSKDGEVLLSVEGVSAHEGNVELTFQVNDSGIGIAKDKQESIFNKFSQADASTTRRFGGSGLGLSICKKLVEMMGGKIGLESEIDKGSRFWFTIPLQQQKQQPTAAEDIPQSASLQGKRLLVVDDHAINNEVAGKYLETLGVEYQSVLSGEEALAALLKAQAEGQPYDMILIDYRMPGMNGFELADALRQQCQPVPHMLLVTAYGKIEGRKEAEAKGFADVLMKPYRIEDMKRALQSVYLCDNAAVMNSADIPPADFESMPSPKALIKDFHARVLVAEDFEGNQVVAKNILSKLGCTVDIANNGEEAVDMLEEAEEGHYDVVLMDCQMPLMGGMEATEEIRKQSWGKKIPIIAMTAAALQGDQEACIASGMNDFIAKPVSIQAMVDVFERQNVGSGH